MTPFSAFQEMLTALSHYQWRIEAALLIVAFDLIVMGGNMGRAENSVAGATLSGSLVCTENTPAGDAALCQQLLLPRSISLIFIAVLAMLGVPLSVLGALLSAGIALGIFSDAYVGTTFLLRLPYRVGDFIEYREQGIKGLVSAINISTHSAYPSGWKQCGNPKSQISGYNRVQLHAIRSTSALLHADY